MENIRLVWEVKLSTSATGTFLRFTSATLELSALGLFLLSHPLSCHSLHLVHNNYHPHDPKRHTAPSQLSILCCKILEVVGLRSTDLVDDEVDNVVAVPLHVSKVYLNRLASFTKEVGRVTVGLPLAPEISAGVEILPREDLERCLVSPIPPKMGNS